MLNKGPFERWVFCKMKVIYMFIYVFLFSLEAFAHCITLFVSLPDAIFVHFVVCSHPQIIHRNLLLSHSYMYDFLIQTLQTIANNKFSRYGIKMTCISKLCTLKQSQPMYMVRGLILERCHIGPQIALFFNYLCNFIHIIWLNQMLILYLNIQF